MIYNDPKIWNSGGLITFTIDSTSYRAKEGMTWGEWVESEYDDGEFSIQDSTNRVQCNDVSTPLPCVAIDGTYVISSDIIIDGGSYNTSVPGEVSGGSSGGGGGGSAHH